MKKEILRDLHSAYLVAGGLWPLLHMNSFEAVTGEKKDKWLVKTVALLVVTTGISLYCSRKSESSKQVEFLATADSLALAAICFYYGGIRHRISRIYLADGVAELLFAGLWIKKFLGTSELEMNA